MTLRIVVTARPSKPTSVIVKKSPVVSARRPWVQRPPGVVVSGCTLASLIDGRDHMIGREAEVVASDDRSDDRNVRRCALGGIVGPLAFASSWATLGYVKTGYSPLHDPISDLAGVGASTRVAMTAGFVVFGAGMGFYAWALRRALPGPAWIAAAATGAATVGVAAFPLHHSSAIDAVHGAFATAGYVTLAATALISATRLARLGHHGWARGAATAGVVSAVSLALTSNGSFEGFFQRAGLTAGDVWIVASAIAIRRACWTRGSYVSERRRGARLARSGTTSAEESPSR